MGRKSLKDRLKDVENKDVGELAIAVDDKYDEKLAAVDAVSEQVAVELQEPNEQQMDIEDVTGKPDNNAVDVVDTKQLPALHEVELLKQQLAELQQQLDEKESGFRVVAPSKDNHRLRNSYLLKIHDYNQDFLDKQCVGSHAYIINHALKMFAESIQTDLKSGDVEI